MGKKGENSSKNSLLEVQGKTISRLTIISIILIFLINFISAVPPVTTTQQFTEGFSIQVPQDNILQIGKDYEFDFHVFNISTGISIRDGISCDFHLYKDVGTEVYFGTDSTSSPTGYYSFLIDKGNFSKVEHSYYFIRCNNSAIGGFGESILYVTYTGEELTSPTILVYIISLVFLVFLIFGTAFISTKLPSKDATDEEGTILQVSMLKHLRPILWVFIWGISMTIMFIISNIGFAYLESEMIGQLFFVFYRIQFYVLMIGLPLYFSWILYKVFKDKEMKKLMERGIQFNAMGGKEL